MGFQETFNERVMPAADRAFGISAILTRGGSSSDAFTAQWENQKFEIVSAEGHVIAYHSRMFMFDKADAVFDSTTVTPRVGDVLTITENGTEKQFEIAPPPDSQAVTEMDGNYRWRVHTKQVK